MYLEKVFNEVGVVADGELDHEDVLHMWWNNIGCFVQTELGSDGWVPCGGTNPLRFKS
jgi:hypothetical protein